MMTNPENCPSVGDQCTGCVGLAQWVVEKTLEEGEYTPHEAKVLTENSGLKYEIDSPHIAEAEPSCIERQVRAVTIAEEIGKAILANRH